MAAATLGAGARPLPVGADTWAALIACASSTGAGAGAGFALPLDLASAAPDVTSTAAAQRRIKAKRFLPAGATQSGTLSSMAIVNSWSLVVGRRCAPARRRHRPTGPAQRHERAPFHPRPPVPTVSAAQPAAANRPGRREQTGIFLDRGEAKPDLKCRNTLVQWNFFARPGDTTKNSIFF